MGPDPSIRSSRTATDDTDRLFPLTVKTSRTAQHAEIVFLAWDQTSM